MNRKDEVRALLRLSPEEVKQRAGEHLVVCSTLDALHQQMAEDIFAEIASAAAEARSLNLILPVGPTGQYPYLARLLNENKHDLSHCKFFFMDEYCDDNGRAVSPTHPLSFRRIAYELFLGSLEYTNLAETQVIFPTEHNVDTLSDQIENAGGIDTCYGGIGIHGHIAFNEPEPGVNLLSCRKVQLNDFTVTMNAVRAHVGGDLVNFPRAAFTLGMKEILQSKRIRLYCRNGSPFDWANAVLRIALFGTSGDDYPVTYIRNKDYTIITDEDTLQTPEVLL
ncbi:MAG: 6-phosphogluconolactonase [Anaerolineae bacterium]|nr:6-phosphogluconolactonase [Anaerolineae bacterium]